MPLQIEFRSLNLNADNSLTYKSQELKCKGVMVQYKRSRIRNSGSFNRKQSCLTKTNLKKFISNYLTKSKMKNYKLKIITSLIVLAVGTIFIGCNKDDKEDPTPTPNTEQMLSFHLHTMVGSNPAAYGVEFMTASGRKFTLGDLRYYISGIVLIKSDGSELPISGKVILAHPATNEYKIGNVPVGNYNGFKFLLGLDSITNHSDPTVYPADNPLSIQSPAIHWSWNSGYIFMKIEGMVDTSLAATGTTDYQYFYHIGLDNLKRSVDFTSSAFSVVSGSDHEIGIEFDLLEALNNVDMRTENATHTMDDMPLAMKIADNWSTSFSLE